MDMLYRNVDWNLLKLILSIDFLNLSFTKDLVDSVVVFIVFIFLPVLAFPWKFQGL
jgi:hypothetical protein